MKRAPLLNSNKIQKRSNFWQRCAEVSAYLPLLQSVAAVKRPENNRFTLNGLFRQLLCISSLRSCSQRHFINGGALVKSNDEVELIELLTASLRIQLFYLMYFALKSCVLYILFMSSCGLCLIPWVVHSERSN